MNDHPSNPTLTQALIILGGELVLLALAIIRLPFSIIRALLGR